MAEVIGKKVVCPRCYSETFLKWVGNRSTGFGSDSQFDDMPDGWTHIRGPSGILCPKCSREFKVFIDNFMREHPEHVQPEWRFSE